METHPTRDELIGFLDELLSPDANLRVEAHLDNCQTCQDSLNAIIDEASGISLKFEPSGELQQSTEVDVRFVVLKELGRGGMGVVFRGFDRELKRDVAIKVTHDDVNPDTMNRFHREAQITARLQHPGIVPVHKTGRMPDGRQYIAMKLVDGQTLASVLKDRDSADRSSRLFSIFADICNTVSYAHSRGIIHRDLKPENVMVGNFGEVQIMDWGLARVLTPGTRQNQTKVLCSEESPITATGSNGTVRTSMRPGSTQVGDVFGTPAYMPPEQARGEQADKSSDVFALGGILFEILTGRAPFDAPTVSVALKKSIESDLQSAFQSLDRSGADAELIALTKQTLSAEPSDRPADAEALRQSFQDFLSRRDQEFHNARLEKARTDERLVAQQKRSRQLLLSSVAILATMTAGLIAGYLYLTEKNTRIANEAETQREQMEQIVRNENEIRDALSNVRVYQAQAEAMPVHAQITPRTLAVKEIEKAATLISGAIDYQLALQFEKANGKANADLARAQRLQERYAEEAQCREEILRLIEHSYFPEDMRICRWIDLRQEFAKIYSRLGVTPDEISRDGVDRISQSQFKAEFVHGLEVWDTEINRHGGFVASGVAKGDDNMADLARSMNWLGRLISRVDPDPFRMRIRQLHGDQRYSEIIAISKGEDAVDSLLDVYVVSTVMNYVHVPQEDSQHYFLRAHQRFPKDFFVNWFLPMTSANQLDYALACYSLRPHNPAVLYALGLAYINDEKPALAAKPFEELTRVAPWYPRGFQLLSAVYDSIGKIQRADELFEISQQKLDNVRPAFAERMKAYQNRNRLDKIEAYDEYLASADERITFENEEETVKALTAEEVAEIERLESLIDKMRAKIEESPAYPAHYGELEVHYQSLCQFLVEAGRQDLVESVIDQAMQDFQRGSRLAPELATPHERMANLCHEYGRIETAIEAIKRAIAIHPRYSPHYDKLQKMCHVLAEQHRARFELEKMHAFVDDSFDQMLRLASGVADQESQTFICISRFCQQFQHFEQAILAQELAIGESPEYVPYQSQLADLHFSAGKHHLRNGEAAKAGKAFDSATEFFEKAVEESNSTMAHERLSDMYYMRSKYEPAMKHLVAAILAHPDYQPHRYRYGDLAVALALEQQAETGNLAAIQTLTDAIEFLSQQKSEHNPLLGIKELLGDLYKAEGNYPAALDAIEYVLKRLSGDNLLREKQAELYVLTNQNKKAEAILTDLYRSSPNNEQTVLNLAHFYSDDGQPEKAASLVRSALASGLQSKALEKFGTSESHESQQ